MPNKSNQSFNSRTYSRQLERELIIGGTIIGVLVGGGLIWLIWGFTQLLVALSCFAGFLVLIGVVWGFLKILELVARE